MNNFVKSEFKLAIPSIFCYDKVILNITKEYPDMYKVLLYKEPLFLKKHSRSSFSKVKKYSDWQPVVSSVQRTKNTVRDLVFCNDFEWFVTFTIDPKKHNRYSYDECRSTLNVWLHKRKTFDPDFKYLIIPEFHKDGAIHFHGLLSHFNGSMRDSHHQTHDGRSIYNVTCFRSGFTTAVKIDDKFGVAKYVTKYITKDFVKQFNRRRFFCSRNLVRPIRTVNSPIFRSSLPIFRSEFIDLGDKELVYIYK